MTTFDGTHHDDTFSGTSGKDKFRLEGGGDDTASGRGGNDTFLLGDSLTAADSIDGGAGNNDQLWLDGDYSAGLVLGATTVTKVETIQLVTGGTYALTTDDGNVAADELMSINGGELDTDLFFDGSAETDGAFFVAGGIGNDTIIGGAGKDEFYLVAGGNETASGGDGADNFNMAGTLDSLDTINGGKGYDTITVTGLGGDDTVVFGPGAITNVENIYVFGNDFFDMKADDTMVKAGKFMGIDMHFVVHQANFDGSAETDGGFHITPGSESGTLLGGDQIDTFAGAAHTGVSTIHGGGGGDFISIAGGAPDVLSYTGVGESTSTGHDWVEGFTVTEDTFDLDVSVSGVAGTFNGSVDTATFDADIAAASGNSPAANNAWVVHANAGDQTGRDFLVVDVNGDGHYSAAIDYLMFVSIFGGSLTSANFI